MLNVIKSKWICLGISLLIILAGVVSYFVQGFNLDIDFTGGTTMTINMEGKQFNIADIDINSDGTYDVAEVYGKMGLARGRNVWGDTTYGVAMSYGDDLVDYDSSTNYIIVTEGGVRLQANGYTETGRSDDMIVVEWQSHSLTVTPNGVFVDGEPLTSGGSGGNVTAVWW